MIKIRAKRKKSSSYSVFTLLVDSLFKEGHAPAAREAGARVVGWAGAEVEAEAKEEEAWVAAATLRVSPQPTTPTPVCVSRAVGKLFVVPAGGALPVPVSDRLCCLYRALSISGISRIYCRPSSFTAVPGRQHNSHQPCVSGWDVRMRGVRFSADQHPYAGCSGVLGWRGECAPLLPPPARMTRRGG